MSTTTTTNSATCGQRFNDGTQTHNQETLKNGLSDVSDGGDATSPPTTPEYRLRGVFCDGNGNPFIDAFVKDISDISDWIKDPERAKHIARYGKPPEATGSQGEDEFYWLAQQAFEDFIMRDCFDVRIEKKVTTGSWEEWDFKGFVEPFLDLSELHNDEDVSEVSNG